MKKEYNILHELIYYLNQNFILYFCNFVEFYYC